MRNLTFIISLILVALIALGIIPRSFAFLLTAIIIAYVSFSKLENATAFFVGFIPFFIALPFTSTFDSFNLWRIVSILIFAKWFFSMPNYYTKTKNWLVNNLRKLNFQGGFFIISALLLIALISLFKAESLTTGIKRIIYFINLSLIAFPIYTLVRQNSEFTIKLFKTIKTTALIVLGVGFVQLIMTYFMPADKFLLFWALQVQKGFFGNAWSEIALHGNTWFSYFQHQLTLRIFSTFTSSHVFPLYLIMSLPAFIVISPKTKKFWILIFLIMLGIVLSSTRGIWATSIFPILLSIFLYRKYRVQQKEKKLIKISLALFGIFILSFFVAYPIFGSSQFRVPSEDLFGERLKSILDFGELSNKTRIEIWKKTLSSIIRNPILGVGIGNFPVVLGQDISLAKAGSSAHNTYLHIIAELGIIALILFLTAIYKILKTSYKLFTQSDKTNLKTFGLFSFLSLTWVFFYLLTDSTLFDERTFLIFISNIAVVFGIRDYG